MGEFVVKQLPYDLSSQPGLALIGKYLKRINLNAFVEPALAFLAGIGVESRTVI
jgi:hypothetical protein